MGLSRFLVIPPGILKTINTFNDPAYEIFAPLTASTGFWLHNICVIASTIELYTFGRGCISVLEHSMEGVMINEVSLAYNV